MEEEIYCGTCQEWKHINHSCFDRDEARADDMRDQAQEGEGE